MIIDKKCTCGNKSTGNTTIRCCNLCGLPLPNEPWHFNLDENIFSRVEKPVKPEIAEAVKKAVQQDRREIIELLENYLLDTNHCFEIEKLKFVNKLSFADLILSIARGLIYGK